MFQGCHMGDNQRQNIVAQTNMTLEILLQNAQIGFLHTIHGEFITLK